MKKLAIAICTLTVAVGAFAQGTIQFNNHFSGGFSYVYYKASANAGLQGAGTADTPAGTVDWAGLGYTKIGGSTYMAALLSANGSGQTPNAFAPVTTTFRTGAGAGIFALTTVTLANVPIDAAVASIQVFAWDNSSGNYNSASAALAAWQAGTIAGGESIAFNVSGIGGSANLPPNLVGLTSFSIYTVPEPATVALAGLAASALLIFRRRK